MGLADLLSGHRVRHLIGIVEAQGRRGDDLAVIRRFTAGVGKLNADLRILFMDELHKFPQPLYMLIRPDAEVMDGDASLRRHRRCFDDDQADLADGAGCVVGLMPAAYFPALI